MLPYSVAFLCPYAVPYQAACSATQLTHRLLLTSPLSKGYHFLLLAAPETLWQGRCRWPFSPQVKWGPTSCCARVPRTRMLEGRGCNSGGCCHHKCCQMELAARLPRCAASTLPRCFTTICSAAFSAFSSHFSLPESSASLSMVSSASTPQP